MLLLHLVYLRIQVLGRILIHLLITLSRVLSGMWVIERHPRNLLHRLLPIIASAVDSAQARGFSGRGRGRDTDLCIRIVTSPIWTDT